MPPGSRALAFASRWFDPQTVSTVFEPLVADWQREWQNAAGLGRTAVRLRGAVALVIAMIAMSPTVAAAPSPSGVRRRIVTRVVLWTAVFGVPLVIPFVNELGRQVDGRALLYLSMLLVPQAVALSFPTAITTVVDLIRTAPEPSREERVTAVKSGFAAVTLMLILVGWVFPAANQQYRVAASRAVSGIARNPGPAPGLRELSIVQLFKDDRLGAHWRSSGDPIFDEWVASGARAEPVLSEIARRTALMVLPIVLMWMRWRALLLPRGRWYSPLPLVLSTPLMMVSYYFLLSHASAVADVLFAPRWFGPWLALGVTIFGALAIDRGRRHVAGLA